MKLANILKPTYVIHNQYSGYTNTDLEVAKSIGKKIIRCVSGEDSKLARLKKVDQQFRKIADHRNQNLRTRSSSDSIKLIKAVKALSKKLQSDSTNLAESDSTNLAEGGFINLLKEKGASQYFVDHLEKFEDDDTLSSSINKGSRFSLQYLPTALFDSKTLRTSSLVLCH